MRPDLQRCRTFLGCRRYHGLCVVHRSILPFITASPAETLSRLPRHSIGTLPDIALQPRHIVLWRFRVLRSLLAALLQDHISG